jgi:hypothetical protein
MKNGNIYRITLLASCPGILPYKIFLFYYNVSVSIQIEDFQFGFSPNIINNSHMLKKELSKYHTKCQIFGI